MKRSQHVSVRVSEEQKEALERLARARDVTVAHLMRQAVLELSQESGSGHVEVRETPATPSRERELGWLAGEGVRLRRYAGQWIALSGDQVVSHGHDYVKVYQRARETGVRVPFIEWIPDTAADIVSMGL